MTTHALPVTLRSGRQSLVHCTWLLLVLQAAVLLHGVAMASADALVRAFEGDVQERDDERSVGDEIPAETAPLADEELEAILVMPVQSPACVVAAGDLFHVHSAPRDAHLQQLDRPPRA